MAFTGGTSLAKQFISKYASNGNLLDLYSDEWIGKYKGLDGMSISDFKKYDAKYGTDYRNHMLLISCDWYENPKSNFSEDLLKVFPKYKYQLRNHSEHVYFDPSFVLINLATKQMATIGLGRKNRFFMTDVETNADISLNLPNDISAQALFGGGDRNYISNFLKLDHAGIVYKFLATLNEMGNLVYSRDCDCTPYLYEELRYAEPDEEGLYEIDGDSYSEPERNEMVTTHEQLNKKIKAHEGFLMHFFPPLEFDALNEY